MIFSVVFESFLRNPTKGLTVDQYRLHMDMHRKRVKRLAVILFRQFESEFPGLNEDIVHDFISIHDLSKVDDQYSIQDPISKRLAETFGKDQNLPEIQDSISAAVSELNRIDKGLASEFFVRNNMVDAFGGLNDKALMLLRIEKIADSVDRGFDRVAHIEFGRTLSKASEFLEDEKDRHMASYLEQVYPFEMMKVETDNSAAILRELFRSAT